MKQYSQIGKDSRLHEIGEGIFQIKLDNISMEISRNGGRIISFKLGQQEILSPKNIHGMYGSTFWPDPQSAWNWPPPPILDEEPYAGGITGDSIRLSSGIDEKNGWQFEKIFYPSVQDTSINIVYRIINISNKPKSVGPWEITRVAAKGLTFFIKGEGAELPPSDLNNISIEDGVVWYAPDNFKFTEGKKYFSTENGGWLAHVENDILFIKKFPKVNPKDLAKGQGAIEIYAKGDKSYIEIENHGAHKTLLSGKFMDYNVKWYLRKLNSELENNRSKKLVTAVEEIIAK